MSNVCSSSHVQVLIYILASLDIEFNTFCVLADERVAFFAPGDTFPAEILSSGMLE